MMPNETWLYRAAAICAFLFATAMLLQEWLLTLIPVVATPEQALAAKITSANLARAWMVFLSMFCALVTYWGVAAKSRARSPGLAGVGFAFCFLFATVELLYRAIELFAVNGRWIPGYLAATDAATKAALGARIEAFGDVVFALYFVLLAAHMLGSAIYSVVAWGGRGLERLVGALLAANAIRLLLRLIGSYAGQGWLEAINRSIYAPIVVVLFVVVGVWLWRADFNHQEGEHFGVPSLSERGDAMNCFAKLKNRYGKLLVVGTVCGLAGLAAGARADDKKQVVKTPFQDAKFVPIDAARPDGAQLAMLWGDPAKGPSAMLLKLKKSGGLLHTHTSDYHLVVLQGTMTHWVGGEREADAKPLDPGSYWFQPGNQAHGNSCLTDECVMFIKWEGKRDVKLAEGPKK